MAIGANKAEMKSKHLVHMTSEVDLEVDAEVLPAEPRRSCGEPFLSQLSVSDTIQACKCHTERDLLTCLPRLNTLRCLMQATGATSAKASWYHHDCIDAGKAPASTGADRGFSQFLFTAADLLTVYQAHL